MKSVVVLGGTGFIGRHVCEKLQREGWAITVPTRRAINAARVQHLPRVTVIETDVHDSGHLLDVLTDHDAVVNLVAILHGSEDDFERVHVELPLSIAEACAAAGVRRVVHVSALGASPDGPSRYQRSKARGEEVLRGAGLDLTILRPSVVFGAGDRFLNLFARLQETFPIVPLAGARTRFQPVWVEDVAQAVAVGLRSHALARNLGQGSVGQTIECVGPDVFTLADLVRLAGRYGSRERAIWPLPDLLARWQAAVFELAPGEPVMSRDNLDSMSIDNVATHEHPGLSTLAITPSSVHSVAPTYLGQRGGRSQLLNYRHSAGR
ncbi:complex I NDUFA9 subunit family protein [Hydrogenophaga sp. BPS33]|uniref:complex I NDUFA9 subunit family protein n=1 Tax=Hydrogenophaga sp. BPS33 TaxID=2651974 RepID=UPI00131F7913|nr:complex I NDUFA9 subunit family protein [Hydrogenophaga sp. BPS33]QHE84241.1 complex I NDUFA9 subunit family protein [Hydrogenophaga sp. BPS33]